MESLGRPEVLWVLFPQKNVLFPELSCYQNIRVWQAVKHSEHALPGSDDLEQLLRDCDLEKKIHANARTLSGGQKRKLQLACGLVGGSKSAYAFVILLFLANVGNAVILVDEVCKHLIRRQDNEVDFCLFERPLLALIH